MTGSFLMGLAMFKKFFDDLTLTTFASGAIACLVGYLSSGALVFQLATKLGLNSIEASQLIGVLCFAMGVITISLSLRYKIPVMYAWSTPGVVVLLSGLKDQGIERAIGIFVVAALISIAVGASGQFDRVMKWIPSEVSSALIAGILLKFCLGAFSAVNTMPLVIGVMILVYLFMRRIYAFMAVPVSLFLGVAVLAMTKGIAVENIDLAIHAPTVWWPQFYLSDILGLAIPMSLVTMTSQNVTGYAVVRSNGYNISGSKLVTWAGITHLFVAPLGGFCLNLASLTAAIIAGPESHPDKNKRYTGAVVSGGIYILMGLFASAFAGLMGVIPPAMVVAIGGLALISVVGVNLENSFRNDLWKESALFTFLVAASDFSFLGMGSAFWSLCVGLLVFNIRKIVDNVKPPKA